jgi:hypothetical protein
MQAALIHLVFPNVFEKLRYFFFTRELLLQVGKQGDRVLVATGRQQVSALQQTLPLLLPQLIFLDGLEQSRNFFFAGEFVFQILQQF